MDVALLIDQCEYFKGLAKEHRQALAAACIEETHEKGDFLFMEGQLVTAVYLLSSGSIQLVKSSPEGKEAVIKTIEPGEIFAEAALLKGGFYPVTANVLQTSVLYKIPKQEFLKLLRIETFRDDFEAGLMKRVRYLSTRILFLSSYDVDERLYQFLREQYGEKQTYKISLSRKDIAAAIGATPETLSRLIARLEKEHLLKWSDSTLTFKPGFWEHRD